MVRWEYKVLSQEVFTEEDLNKMGKDGWELIAVFKDGLFNATAVFKRPEFDFGIKRSGK